MSVTFDGQRSLNRRWYAKKLLARAKEMGLPAMATTYEGFRFSVTNQDPDLEMGRVTAPDGLIVACVEPDKLSVSHSDYWLSPVTPARQYNRLDGDKSGATVHFYAASFGVVPNTPARPKDTLTDFPPLFAAQYPDSPPKPSLRPWASEMYCLDHAMTCVDVNYSTSSDVLFYCVDGTAEKKLVAATLTSGADWKAVVQGFPSGVADSRAAVHWMGAYRWPENDGPDSTNMICLYTSHVKSDGGGFFTVGFIGYLSHVMFNQLPAGLRVVLSKQWPNYTRCIGSYGFSLAHTKEPILLQAVDATDSALDPLYFSSNPAHDGWKVFLCIYNADAGTILNFGAAPFVEAFYNLSGVNGGAGNAFPATYPPGDHGMWTTKIANMRLWRTSGGQGGDGVYVPIYTPIYDGGTPPNIIRYDRTGWSINWDRVRYGVAQWFAWPNNNFWNAYDSAMFHDHNGNVFTWTRLFGTVAINDTLGAVRVNVNIPAAASAAGVRPEIYPAEGGSYWCRCVEEKWGVRGLYVGSPFGDWLEVPQLSGYRMVEVRLATYNHGLSDCVFLCVFSDGADYYTGVFAEQTWRITGKIQNVSGPPSDTAWAISTYGDGAMSSNIREQISTPPATPQRAVCGDYSQYEAMIP